MRKITRRTKRVFVLAIVIALQITSIPHFQIYAAAENDEGAEKNVIKEELDAKGTCDGTEDTFDISKVNEASYPYSVCYENATTELFKNAQVYATKSSDSYKSGPYYQKLTAVQFTDNQVDNLLAVARSQVGYHEGANSNDLSGTSTSTVSKYTEYAAYHGTNNVDWCAYFVSWCARQAGISTSIIPSTGACGTIRTKAGTFYDISSGVAPQPGDLLLFEPYDSSTKSYYVAPRVNGIPNLSSHVAIVRAYEGGRVYVYEGNANHVVKDSNCSWQAYQGNSNHLQGFVRPNYASGAGAGSNLGDTANVTVTITGAENIGTTTATLRGHCYKNGSSVWVSTCGLYIGTSMSNMSKINTETVSNGANNKDSGTGFDIWYDLENELGYKLTSGTTYYYRFYCVHNGTEYLSDVRSFTTQATVVIYDIGGTLETKTTTDETIMTYSTCDGTLSNGAIWFSGASRHDFDQYAVLPDGRKRFRIAHLVIDGNTMDKWLEDSEEFSYYYYATNAISDIPQNLTITTESERLQYNYSLLPSYANESVRIDWVSGDKNCVSLDVIKNSDNTASIMIFEGKSAGTATYKVVNQESKTAFVEFTITVLDTTPPEMYQEGKITKDEKGFTITGEVWNSGEAMPPEMGVVLWRNNTAEGDVRDIPVTWKNGDGSISLTDDPHNDNYTEETPDYSYMRYYYNYRVNYADFDNHPGVYNITIFAKDSHGNINSRYYSVLYTPQDAGTDIEMTSIIPSETTVAMEWTDIETISSYNVYRKTVVSQLGSKNGNEELTDADRNNSWDLLGNTIENKYVDETAVAGVQYYYAVTACLEYDGKIYESEINTSSTGGQAIQLLPLENRDGLVVTLQNPDENYIFTGSAISPAVVVTNNGEKLVEGVDYTIKYSRNINASTHALASSKPKITITGKGNLTGSASTVFDIQPKNLQDDDVVIGEVMITANSKAVPVISYGKLRLTGKDYTVADADRKYITDDTMVVTGKGNYSGAINISVKVVEKKNLKKFTVEVDKTALTYNGKPQTISYLVKDASTKEVLKENIDYIVTGLEDNKIINAGMVKFTVTGINGYTGSINKSYKIKPLALEQGMRVKSITGKRYIYKSTGVTINEDITVTDPSGTVLVEGTDYKISYSGNKKKGTAKYKITFVNNYKGSKAVTGSFTIIANPLTDNTDGLEIVMEDKIYGGKPDLYKSVPHIMVNGVALKNSDYACTYYTDPKMSPESEIQKKNLVMLPSGINAMNIYVKIVGKGNYAATDNGYAMASYQVIRGEGTKDIRKARVTIVDENGKKINRLEYTGKELRPNIKVEYKDSTGYVQISEEQYKVSYVNNVQKGKATIVITGIGEYAGSKTANFTISQKNIKNMKDWLKDLFVLPKFE